MQNEYSICPANLQDVNDIYNIEAECFSIPWSIENITFAVENPNCVFLLAKNIQQKLVGYMNMECVLDEGYVGNIAVSTQFRRKGIAKLLINTAECIAKQKSLAFITLEVRESNIPAIELYISLGFKNVGKRQNFYSNPKENAMLLTKYL